MFKNMTVRFFVQNVDCENEEDLFSEVSEYEFLESEGTIEYDRNTVFENGVDQICLTKYLY